jgi:2'-5' RNA ligase
MKRIFIAIKVDPSNNLAEIMSSLKSELNNERIKWTDPENIHITLLFLGDTEETKIGEISTLLKDRCSGTGEFELIIKGLGVFKNLNDPTVIWTGIVPSMKLDQLNESIVNGVRNIGIKVDIRPFKPHITLGRIKSFNSKPVLKRFLEDYQEKEIQKIAVKEIILYESKLFQTGPKYNAIGVFSLK